MMSEQRRCLVSSELMGRLGCRDRGVVQDVGTDGSYRISEHRGRLGCRNRQVV